MAFVTAKAIRMVGEDILPCLVGVISEQGLCLLCPLFPSLGSLARAGHARLRPELPLVWRLDLGFRGWSRIRDPWTLLEGDTVPTLGIKLSSRVVEGRGTLWAS